MKDKAKEKLLQDVLRDASADFRQEVFEASLRELRRRRHRARPGLPLAIAAAFVLSTGLLFLGVLRTKKDDRVHLRGGTETASVSAQGHMALATYSGPGMAIVETGGYRSELVQNSDIRQPVELLGDAELLALFPGRPAGLIAGAGGTVELVLLDAQPRIVPQ